MIFDDLYVDFTTLKGGGIITYFQIHSILTNKANFGNDKMNITIDKTSNYKILSALQGEKTKPIQTQLKPIQTQNKPKTNPIQTQTNPNKPNFKGKMLADLVDLCERIDRMVKVYLREALLER